MVKNAHQIPRVKANPNSPKLKQDSVFSKLEKENVAFAPVPL